MAETLVIPIVNPKAMEATLPYVLPHVDEILADYGDLADADTAAVLNDLFSGNTILWTVFVKSRFAGFLILRVVNYRVNESRPILYIEFAWKNPEIEFDFSKAVEPHLTKFAKQNKCVEIRAKVKEKSIAQKLIRQFGAEQGLVEYRRVL